MAYSPKWQKRFDFYEKHGLPNTPGFKAEFKNLGFMDRLTVSINFIGFFFSWIYMLVLGRPKQAVTILVVSILFQVVVYAAAYILVSLGISPKVFSFVSTAGGFLLQYAHGQIANVSYYYKEIKGEPDCFNPYKYVKLW
ncbi:DUF2628 domain-containing protein [Thorsellia anophelis]|uniref:DUF2628 domain-containing protein n=1 Tax=Thorsellia anophelis DSM 18579 TaxID=1123402 RepID=A0A1I0B5B7_9GAMM|nr:DUF2628 domain-containing protein [Thorsellia anophelis]SET01582.1 Protein of unknown function [Thorsellia anophelis DSM 18579]